MDHLTDHLFKANFKMQICIRSYDIFSEKQIIIPKTDGTGLDVLVNINFYGRKPDLQAKNSKKGRNINYNPILKVLLIFALALSCDLILFHNYRHFKLTSF